MVRAVLLALLVGLALPLGVAGAPTGGTGPASIQDVSILTLDGPTRSGFSTVSMDIATSMAVQHQAADARLERYTLVERLARKPSTDDRKSLLFEAATGVEIEISALRDDERALRRAYVEREITAEEYVRRLALIKVRANELSTTLDLIQRRADGLPQFSLRGRVRLLDASLIGFSAPVRGRALEAYAGAAPPTRVFVQTAANGTVLATIDDGQYVREGHRADNRDSETTTSISVNEADQLASELYPSAYNVSTSIRTGINSLSGGLFRVDIELREGFVTAYLDGGTGQIFFEVQERRLDLLGPRPSAVGTDNGTRLVVNRTYPGGPLHVAVTDNATGTPLSTSVYVDGDRVRTGADGAVWTLAPAAVVYEVRAVGPDGNVTIDVRPLSPSTVGG